MVRVIQMVFYGVFLSWHYLQHGGITVITHVACAVIYLQIRAETPAATLWLVTNGIFCSLKDTTTTLIYSLLFTMLNIILDALFILCGVGLQQVPRFVTIQALDTTVICFAFLACATQ